MADVSTDDLTIPSNIQLDTPINLTMNNDRPVIVCEWKKNSTDFQLYNSFQPGLYEYDFWVGNIEPGIIYLKAFEITQNYAPLRAGFPGGCLFYHIWTGILLT